MTRLIGPNSDLNFGTAEVLTAEFDDNLAYSTGLNKHMGGIDVRH